MRRALFSLALTAVLASCSAEPGAAGGGAAQAGAPAAAPATDPLTRRQKDSIYAASKMPHAGALGRAMGAADAASAQAAAHDSVR